MAEKESQAEEEDDYMGDLSLFIPPEISNPSLTNKKISNNKTVIPQSSHKKKSKTVPWQEQRKIDRERKQIEEDQKILKGLKSEIPSSNLGFKMLKQMGYTPGSALGKDGTGRAEPVGLEIRRSRAGLGSEGPTWKEKAKREVVSAEKKRKREEDLMSEFGCRQKTQWRSRRVVGDFEKAKKALAQLENIEIIEPEKDSDDEDQEEEDEEEEITEEDLQEILMKLRDEHQYCLYCGCQLCTTSFDFFFLQESLVLIDGTRQ